MLIIPTITNHAFVIESKNIVENLAQLSLDESAELKFFESSTQVALTHGCHGLLSVPHLLVRTNGRKTLTNYFQSHVVTSKEYLRVMQQKAMDKEVVE